MCAFGANIVSGSTNPPQRGVYEVSITCTDSVTNPYVDATLTVTFTRPDGSKVTVDGFYDGSNVYKARAYCDKLGSWLWTSASNKASLNGRQGSFTVVASTLKGKLSHHPQDSHQFAYDNGEWFLHVGDTGYRYVCDGEPYWQEYIDQAAQMGATKIRTWFNDSRSGVQGLWETGDRTRFNLSYWQEIDRRVTYGLNQHPGVILQLIPYGEDSTELTRYYNDDPNSKRMMQYAQARFSAFPNIHWCISNDRD
ncbi:MAG: DUF5060 domain-containing protein, partial [Planctomycetes bacterium]|nr:DUF5060 domain-containing protein [Planctomycetota bacterium]